jgi:hypothetical protein
VKTKPANRYINVKWWLSCWTPRSSTPLDIVDSTVRNEKERHKMEEMRYGGGGIQRTKKMRLELVGFIMVVVVLMLLFALLELFVRYLWQRSYPSSTLLKPSIAWNHDGSF